jgi:hypothetical protein
MLRRQQRADEFEFALGADTHQRRGTNGAGRVDGTGGEGVEVAAGVPSCDVWKAPSADLRFSRNGGVGVEDGDGSLGGGEGGEGGAGGWELGAWGGGREGGRGKRRPLTPGRGSKETPSQQYYIMGRRLGISRLKHWVSNQRSLLKKGQMSARKIAWLRYANDSRSLLLL